MQLHYSVYKVIQKEIFKNGAQREERNISLKITFSGGWLNRRLVRDIRTSVLDYLNIFSKNGAQRGVGQKQF